jgi:hypothetical protein
MLLGFFDESGHHGAHLLQLTLGGCIAFEGDWRSFKNDWDSFLNDNSIAWFHANAMRDKELSRATEIVGDHRLSCYGSTIFIPDEHRPSKRKQFLQKLYEHGAIDMIWHSARHAEAVQDDIALVFARHGDFSLDRIKKTFRDFQSVDPQLRSVAVGEPRDCVALQAADFVAYEVKRYHEAELLAEEPHIRRPLLNVIQSIEWRRSPPALSRRFYLEHPLPPDLILEGHADTL